MEIYKKKNNNAFIFVRLLHYSWFMTQHIFPSTIKTALIYSYNVTFTIIYSL